MNVTANMGAIHHPVLMLCRNSLELTKKAVASVLAQDITTQLRVIDNGSSDGTTEWCSAQPRTFVESFNPPLGVSSGWNYGLTDLFRRHDHVLVVNNDLVLRKDFYGELLADGGGFVTGVSVDKEDAINGEWRYQRRNHPDFSAFLIRREVWLKVGAFDEQFAPAYYEDNDYHIRMYQAGVEAYTIGIPFFHYASGTLKHASAYEQARIKSGADRNREKFLAKWGCYPGTPEYSALFLLW